MPVEVGDPAALGAEEALQNHAAVASLQRVVHRKVPARDCVESVDDAVEAVFFVTFLGEPAATEDAGELPILLG